MLTTIMGYYDNGHIVLVEQPPVHTKTEVIVTFLTEEKRPDKPKERKLGLLKGKIFVSDDFDEPLEDLKDYM